MEQTDSRNARTFDRRLPTEGELLAALVRRSMFWTPERAAPSAWIEHVPFAFWLVDVLRPRTIVELGTSTGVSYSAFCQAVTFLQLPTSCIAVDTWKGDEHVGLYSEDVYREFESFHNQRYGAFSRLVKSTFDQAVRHFDDGSVDLLHIDGVHTYEAVRHDYESWLPKLSADGVVLFHDTNVRENGFGVFRLWSEIIDSHSHFSFLHGHGLGILGIGDRYSHELRCLFDASNSDLLNSAVRDIFFSLGRSVRVVSEQTALDGTLAEQQARITGLTEAISERNLQIKELVNAIETREAQIASSEQTLDTTRTELKHSNLQIAELGALLGDQETKLNSREAAVRALYASHSWQITAPLRAAGALMKMFYHSRFGYPLVLAHCALKARSLVPTIADE
jgi:Methyltransferase domain